MTRKIVAVSRLTLAIVSFALVTLVPAVRALALTPQSSQTIDDSGKTTLPAQETKDDDDDNDDDNDDDDDDDGDDSELSSSIRRTILESIASQTQVSVSELRIVAVRQETYTDSCLGLGGPATSCAREDIPGYLVLVARGENGFVYRTNASGSVVVLDQTATTNYTSRSETVVIEESTTTESHSEQTQVTVEETTGLTQTTQAVFQAIAQRYQVSTSSLRVVDVRRRVWENGCLGLSVQGRSCSQATVPGYLMAVTNGSQVFVYRTDLTGSTVVLDEAASQLRTAQLRVRNTRVAFSDVSTSYWAAEYISQLAALNIIDGYPDGTYRPDRPVTRAEFAAIIRRAFEVAEVREAIRFVDVDQSYWAYSAIQESYRMGFFSGAANNLFQPVVNLSRGDVLFALARGLRFSTSSSVDTLLANYTDVTVSSQEARMLLAALTERGIIVNRSDVRSLSLERTVTRAEVAVIVYQTLVSLGRVEVIESPYVVVGSDHVDADDEVEVEIDRGGDGDDDDDDDDDDRSRRNCNQGIGNGAEGCDPGNSRPHGGSNDEGGRPPGGRSR